ncbi:hypothetical protein niasHT_011450 [Heterodera trifolii]|uniref:Uncharacterized protein n=1 Tax=Heterodera trifolii TaxID=157864 RepID=A0ABD2L0Z9_9BILA
MGVAREFGQWALNAREFRRAGLNPRVWLARRVNQSATDAVGGAVIFSVNVADPSPLDAAALSPGGADPLSSTDPLFSLSRGPLRRRGPPLFTAAVLSHHSVVRAVRTPSLPRTLSLLPRPPPYHSVVRAARTPSLHRRGPHLFHGPLPTIQSSVATDPPLSTAAREFCCASLGGARGGGASGKLGSKSCLRQNTFAVKLRGWWNDGL